MPFLFIDQLFYRVLFVNLMNCNHEIVEIAESILAVSINPLDMMKKNLILYVIPSGRSSTTWYPRSGAVLCIFMQSYRTSYPISLLFIKRFLWPHTNTDSIYGHHKIYVHPRVVLYHPSRCIGLLSRSSARYPSPPLYYHDISPPPWRLLAFFRWHSILGIPRDLPSINQQPQNHMLLIMYKISPKNLTYFKI